MTAKKAHYIAVIKTNQPTTHRQFAALPWTAIPVQHTASTAAHGGRETRSIKTCAIADNLGGITFPHARLALRLHRRRRSAGRRETRTTVYAVTSLDAHRTSPAGPANAIRGHWGIENSSPNIGDVTFAEDASRVHTGTARRAMATFRDLAISALKILGADNIAKTARAIRDEPTRALTITHPLASPTPRPVMTLETALGPSDTTSLRDGQASEAAVVEHQGFSLGLGLQTVDFQKHDRVVASRKFGVQGAVQPETCAVDVDTALLVGIPVDAREPVAGLARQ